MAEFNFSDSETIVRTEINPAIQQQFAQGNTLYNAFRATGPPPINARGYRIPYYQTNLHPWQEENGILAHTQLLRGELPLPHPPSKCKGCKEAFQWQLDIITRHIDVLRAMGYIRGRGHRGPLGLSSRRKEVAEALRALAALGATQGQEEAA